MSNLNRAVKEKSGKGGVTTPTNPSGSLPVANEPVVGQKVTSVKKKSKSGSSKVVPDSRRQQKMIPICLMARLLKTQIGWAVRQLESCSNHLTMVRIGRPTLTNRDPRRRVSRLRTTNLDKHGFGRGALLKTSLKQRKPLRLR